MKTHIMAVGKRDERRINIPSAVFKYKTKYIVFL